MNLKDYLKNGRNGLHGGERGKRREPKLSSDICEEQCISRQKGTAREIGPGPGPGPGPRYGPEIKLG